MGAQLGIFYFTCILIIVTSGLFFGVEYAIFYFIYVIVNLSTFIMILHYVPLHMGWYIFGTVWMNLL